MHTPIRIILALVFLPTLVLGQSDFEWVQRASLPASGRYGPFTFTIGGYGYVAGGGNASSVLSDCWRYDPVADSWTSMASMPSARRHGASFSVNGMGYVACGGSSSDFTTDDLYMYDPVGDTWTQKASLPATARNGCYGFALNGYGYVGAGNYGSATGPYLADLWKYDPVADSWTASNGIPGLPRYGSTPFVVNGKGYAHGGRDASLVFTNELWEFDPGTEAWTSKPPMPGLGRSWTMAMAFPYDAVVAGGKDVGGTIFADAYLYYPTANLWNQVPDYPGESGWSGASFGIGDRTFGGLGARVEPNYSYHNDFWELVKVDFNGVDGPERAGGHLTVAPDPTSGGSVSIALPRSMLNDRAILRITDATGRIVREAPYIATQQVDVEDLSPGVYSVGLWVQEGALATGTLLISR